MHTNGLYSLSAWEHKQHPIVYPGSRALADRGHLLLLSVSPPTKRILNNLHFFEPGEKEELVVVLKVIILSIYYFSQDTRSNTQLDLRLPSVQANHGERLRLILLHTGGRAQENPGFLGFSPFDLKQTNASLTD